MSFFFTWIVALLTSLAGGTPATQTDTTPATDCSAAVVTWAHDEAPRCDLNQPQQLNITGTEPTQCDDMGGTWSPDGTCANVDF